MNEELKRKCDVLVENRKKISKTFIWEHDMMMTTAALIAAEQGIEVDITKLKECEKVLKANTGVFSDFRSNVKMLIVVKMALSGDPEKYFNDVKNAVEAMKKTKCGSKEYKALAAISIVDHGSVDKISEIAKKMDAIYKQMKANHPILTSYEDIPLASVLALTELDIDKIGAECEKSYGILKTKFFDSNSVQTLSHVLSINDSIMSEAKCQKVFDIFNLLKDKGHKYGKGFELSALGTLALTDRSNEELANMIIEADDYLKRFKGFGDFLLGRNYRRMFSAMLVSSVIKPGNDNITVSLGGILSAVISSEICMIIIVSSCACSAASH